MVGWIQNCILAEKITSLVAGESNCSENAVALIIAAYLLLAVVGTGVDVALFVIAGNRRIDWGRRAVWLHKRPWTGRDGLILAAMLLCAMMLINLAVGHQTGGGAEYDVAVG